MSPAEQICLCIFGRALKYKFSVSSGGFARHITEGSKAVERALPVRVVPINSGRITFIPRMIRC